jgi:hypothetical protein
MSYNYTIVVEHVAKAGIKRALKLFRTKGEKKYP